MSDDPDALRRLEDRVSALETELRELRARAWLASGPRAPAHATTAPATGGALPASTSPKFAPITPRSRPGLPVMPARARRELDLEQWFGQRGLLVVGVVALIAAGGYFLKYSFDRGWIAPWLRVTGSLSGGVALALFGERLVTRGLKRYGAGLIGAGGGLAYLGLWAAAGPYALLPRDIGAPLLAGLTAVIAWRAVVHDVEVLGALAIAGAFLAPLFLPSDAPSLSRLLVYLEVVGAGAAQLAVRTGWSSPLVLALVGYFLLPIGLAGEHLDAPIGAWHALLGGVAALTVAKRAAWAPIRVLALLGAWGTLAIIAGIGRHNADNIYVPAAAVVLALAAFAHDRRQSFATARLPDWPRQPADVAVLLSPFMFCLVVDQTPVLSAAWLIGALAALYLAGGWAPRAAGLVAIGAALLAVAVAEQWDYEPVTIAWLAIALLAVLGDRRVQPGLRPVAIAIAWLAGAHLMLRLPGLSWPSATAFTERWAVTLYIGVIASAIAAYCWRATPEDAASSRVVDADALWLLSATLLFTGVSIAIGRYFASQAFATSLLAGRLALSLWWLIFAGVAVAIGFTINRREVRTAGLVVAGAAALKIAFYDLSMLDALYRVAALFGLALVALAVAYLYSRRAKALAQPA